MPRARAIVSGYGSPAAARAAALVSSWLAAVLGGAAGFFLMVAGLGAPDLIASGVAMAAVLFGGLAVHATLPSPPRRADVPRGVRPRDRAPAPPMASVSDEPFQPSPSPWPPRAERPPSPDAAAALADLEREYGELARVARARARPVVIEAA